MAKQTYPGNWVNRMSSGHGGSTPTGVVCQPGRVYFHLTGYALITSTGATSWPVTLPSPDMRPDDKPRADIVGLVLPSGANVAHVGIRIPDMRRDRGQGTAFSGLVATNTNRLKFADAIASASGITTTTVSTNSGSLVAASGTIPPGSSLVSVVTAATLAGAETMQVFSTDNTGTAAGSNITSSLVGGTPIIVEVSYYVDDAVADLGDVRIPFLREN
jgi:hypothetical protein